MSAPRPVQGAEFILNKQLISEVSGFPTEFCTVVLKTFRRGMGRAVKTSPGRPTLRYA
jgi:hypothetical protein